MADELFRQVAAWGQAREIPDKITFDTQFKKIVEELGELARASFANDIPKIRDAIGDMIIATINLATIENMDAYECLHEAFESVKDRTGTTTERGFIKDKE